MYGEGMIKEVRDKELKNVGTMGFLYRVTFTETEFKNLLLNLDDPSKGMPPPLTDPTVICAATGFTIELDRGL